MDLLITIAVVALAALWFASRLFRPGAAAGLGLSGIFDVRHSDRRVDPNVVSMGDFELDLARELGRNVQAGAAVVVNDSGASLAVDGELRAGALRLRGEYVRTDARPSAGRPERLARRGWHVTAQVEAGEVAGIPLTPWLRYDTATGAPLPPAETSGDAAAGGRTERLSRGLHETLFEALVLKAEYRRVLAPPGAPRPGRARTDAISPGAVSPSG